MVQGKVIDDRTGIPISNVLVYNKNKIGDSTTTDESGNFELSSISGGFRCPPMMVIAEKNSYEKTETSIEVGEKNQIRLKSESQD